MALARPGHRGDTRGGKPPQPTVPSLRHASTMAGSERDSLVQRAMQEGGGAKETAPGSGEVEGYQIQSIQHVWTNPGDGDLVQIIGAGDLSSRL